MATHHEGPLLGSSRAGGGLFLDKPIQSVARGQHIEFFDDFHNYEAAANFADLWDETAIGAGVGTAAEYVTAVGRGIVRMTTNAVNNQGSSIQPQTTATQAGSFAATATGQDIMFEAGVTCSAWGTSDWLIGLCINGAVMSAAGAPVTTGCDNFAAFHHLEAGTGVPLLKAAGTAVANVQTVTSTWTTALTNSTYYRFGILISGLSRVRFFINRQPVSNWATLTVNLATGALLKPTFAVITTGAAITMDIDYAHVLSERPY